MERSDLEMAGDVVRVLVTGGRGKVGSHAAAALLAAGHDVTATDLHPPEHERDLPDQPAYVRADLTDPGAAFAVVDGHDAVVHTAAIPDPLHDPPMHVFATNVLSAMHVVDACVRTGVSRLVNVSSETVPGIVFGEGRVQPPYLPIDEDVPAAAQDAYGFGKEVVERWCDRVVLRHPGLSVLTVRPSWVIHPGNAERNLGPMVRDPFQESGNYWSWTDADDLARALRLACEVEHEGHTVLYVAQPDNTTGRPLAELVERVYPELVDRLRGDLTREDASGIDSSRAMRVLGWEPTRTWRDHLDEDGRAH